METLIFDCDGVLVDSEVIAEATLIAQLRDWLPDLQSDTVLRHALGMTTENILIHLEQLSAHSLPEDALPLVDDAIDARLAKELKPIEGVAEAVAKLNMPLAIVSNSRRSRVLNSLRTTGLDAWLGKYPLFTAEQASLPKPDPAVYLLAAKEMGRRPEDCLVVEDSVSGVTAAKGAGMTVIGFIGASHIEGGHDQQLREAGAWEILSGMHGLQSLVERWRRERTRRTRHAGS
ncbi:HAD family hydrolase [Marinobacter nanhaiticus D15-8W]|uniref:HAD family hydrolase n=1 Tax=Marinobacter nanhaiticus D15-8W TaxID=626887 RepID=N6X5B7_9GAMM|nr:HAD-IA family hydrolase [Marinobacter nanhaiticus]ENO16258.1 HAD family hydrolase [Marinobacter nanhaiticus D15-8W]BES72885.1 HAD family hydrolase [Marinobacter nanhaiticus D15-8W]